MRVSFRVAEGLEIFPSPPALSRREREPDLWRCQYRDRLGISVQPDLDCFSTPEIDWMYQVGGFLKNTSVSPLSLRERVRVRGF
jgi:hypothetical protein